MGFLRKATWVATGGASGLVFKANSKKERTANAMEKMARGQTGRGTSVRSFSSPRPKGTIEERGSSVPTLDSPTWRR